MSKTALLSFSPILLTLGIVTALAGPAVASPPVAAQAASSQTRSGPSATRARPPTARPMEGVVNLNTATAAELQLLPSIGPAKARDIVAYRSAKPFKGPDDLLEVKGIGRKLLERLRAH